MLKLSKCEFFRQQIKFLGHIVTPAGMSMDPEKLRAIREFPAPRNKKEMQSFIGFWNFYRKFADNHASVIGPLIDLTKKDTPWIFGDVENKMFETVKKSFTERYLWALVLSWIFIYKQMRVNLVWVPNYLNSLLQGTDEQYLLLVVPSTQPRRIFRLLS